MTAVKDTLDRWKARIDDLLTHPLTQPIVRAVRTYAQVFVGVYTASVLALSGEVTNLAPFADLGVIGAANAAGIVAVITAVQNWLEVGHVPRG